MPLSFPTFQKADTWKRLLRTCIHIHIYIYIFVCNYIYIYISVCVCVFCIYIYSHISMVVQVVWNLFCWATVVRASVMY